MFIYRWRVKSDREKVEKWLRANLHPAATNKITNVRAQQKPYAIYESILYGSSLSIRIVACITLVYHVKSVPDLRMFLFGMNVCWCNNCKPCNDEKGNVHKNMKIVYSQRNKQFGRANGKRRGKKEFTYHLPYLQRQQFSFSNWIDKKRIVGHFCHSNYIFTFHLCILTKPNHSETKCLLRAASSQMTKKKYKNIWTNRMNCNTFGAINTSAWHLYDGFEFIATKPARPFTAPKTEKKCNTKPQHRNKRLEYIISNFEIIIVHDVQTESVSICFGLSNREKNVECQWFVY